MAEAVSSLLTSGWALGDLYQPFIMIRNMKEKEPIQAALPYVLNIQ